MAHQEGDRLDDTALAGLRVLVVDDEEDPRELLEALLGSFGASVTPARSAEEAFALFRKSRPDVVVTDIWMPRVDGYELVRRIRTLAPEEGGRTSVVAFSAGGTATRSLEAGFDAHVPKGTDPLRLVRLLRGLAHARS